MGSVSGEWPSLILTDAISRKKQEFYGLIIHGHAASSVALLN